MLHSAQQPSSTRNGALLKERLSADGYLLLRGLLDRGTVLRARTTVLDYLDCPSVTSRRMEGRSGIAVHPDVTAVTEAPELWELFESHIFEKKQPALTFSYKWLRAVKPGGYTGVHWDNVYMGLGETNQLYTVWIPLGDIGVEGGTLAICPGTHCLPSFGRLRQTYGTMDVDRDKVAGWFTEDPMEVVELFGSRWLTENFRMGDVLIFGMHTLHASTTNLTDRVRLSCDVRFQPKDDKADSRWVGSECIGHTSHGKVKLQPMAEARMQWGL